MIQKITTFYQKYISQFGEVLDKYFGGILVNLQMHFVKKKTHHIVHKGEVFLINLGVNIGSEYNKIRPGVVISNKEINKGNTVIILPISSKKKTFLYDVQVTSEQTNMLNKTSIIKTSHIRNIDKKRLIKKIGTIPHSILLNIEKNIISMITKKPIPPKE